MIQTVRRRFIAIAMLSIFMVVGSIIASINVSTYHQTMQEADHLLEVIANNKGNLPQDHAKDFTKPLSPQEFHHTPTDHDKPNRKNDNPKQDDRSDMSPEAIYTTRYFTVTLDSSGSLLSVNTEKIAAVDATQAGDMAISVFQQNKNRGYYKYYRYCAVSADSETQYIFLDCSASLNAYYDFMWTSIGISLGGLLLVFILVLVFSRLAIKPVIDSYNKQKQFITDASHELKTPLTIIDANTEVLEMTHGENEWTQSIHNQVNRLSVLTGELVTLARMEEKKNTSQMNTFLLSETVNDVAEPYYAVAQSHNKQLQVEIENGILCQGDESALRRLVGLLLDNAMKYSAEQSEIKLQLKCNGKRKILTVENSVSTPLTENPDQWFERFYRSDTSRNSNSGGYGIGLATAKAIVTAHKGKITAKVINQTRVQITVTL